MTSNTRQKRQRSKGNILILCAHSDDQILGVGGLMAKYSSEGYNIYTYIFSYGESSHPHMQLRYIAKRRVMESKEADDIVGGSGVSFLGLKDTGIEVDFVRKNMMPKLKRIIMDNKPKKIFTHSSDDMLPDHRAVHKLVLKAYDELAREQGLSCAVYSFDVWSLWNLAKRNLPVLVVDVTDYFRYKIKALHTFKSQISFFSYTILVNFLYVATYFRAIVNGIKYGFRFAEIYYKVR